MIISAFFREVSIKEENVFSPFNVREIQDNFKRLQNEILNQTIPTTFSEIKALFDEFEQHYPSRILSWLKGYADFKRDALAEAFEVLQYHLELESKAIRAAILNEAKSERKKFQIKFHGKSYQKLSGSVKEMALGRKNSVLYLSDDQKTILKMRLALMNRTLSHLRLSSLMPSTISPILAESVVEAEEQDELFQFPNEPKVNLKQLNAQLMIFPYYKRGSLFSYFKCQRDNKDDFPKRLKRTKVDFIRIRNAALKMARALKEIEKNGFFFADAKLENWLINDDGSLVIEDAISFLASTKGEISVENLEEGFGVLTTEGYLAPEKGKLNVSQVHAYLLGINLYQMLSGCSVSYLVKCERASFQDKKELADCLSFDFPFMKNERAKELRSIIKGLLNTSTRKRTRLAHAISLLEKPYQTRSEKSYELYTILALSISIAAVSMSAALLMLLWTKTALAASVVSLASLTSFWAPISPVVASRLRRFTRNDVQQPPVRLCERKRGNLSPSLRA